MNSLQGNDITALEQDYLQPLISMIRAVNMMIAYGAVLFFGVDKRLAVIIISTSVLSVAISRSMGNTLTKKRNIYQKQMGNYVTVITDLLEGFHLINRMTVEKISRRHETCLEETAEKRYEYGKRKSMVLCFGELMTKAVRIITFAAIAILFVQGEITVGVGVATLSYVAAFMEPIDTILYDVTMMQSMKGVKEKVLSYVQQVRGEERRSKKHLDEGIVFRDVTYTKEDFALKHLNFRIEKGKKYAITGPSGAGKSTLLKLLMGYEKPDSGVIEMDGEDVSGIDLSGLVSYTDQQEHIFRAGVWDNITVFHSYPAEQCEAHQIRDAGGRFGEQYFHNLLKSVPTEFFSALLARTGEENCQCFSGGERQAIAFLRMMAKNSDLILMDEPFSAIDAPTRAALQRYLFQAEEWREKTILMVTHHVEESDLENYDGVIRIENSGLLFQT